jgi:transcriptional regulator with GAF, ATPase, and Fis domain
VLLIFSSSKPMTAALPLVDGSLVVGREALVDHGVDDGRMSRRHTRIARTEREWVLEDLDSKNGTYVDRRRIAGSTRTASSSIVRIGDSLFLLVDDVTPHLTTQVVVQDGIVVGATLRQAWDVIAKTASVADPLHLMGETGVGKELAARHFHESARRTGPLVAVNCAAVPASLAERLFFGVRRGAYSGAAADAEGYVQAAHGGTLFLDEVGDLDPGVQAKLLRTLDAKEVTPLGAAHPRKVDFLLCSATNATLRQRVDLHQFRADLFHRLMVRVVTIPPLRERREDLAWLAESAARARGAAGVHLSLVEALLERRWPGNTRELLSQVRAATAAALESASGDNAVVVHASHLPHPEPVSAVRGGGVVRAGGTALARPEIIEALQRAGGNVSETARRLGLHRNQLRRLIDSLEIDIDVTGEGVG